MRCLRRQFNHPAVGPQVPLVGRGFFYAENLGFMMRLLGKHMKDLFANIISFRFCAASGAALRQSPRSLLGDGLFGSIIFTGGTKEMKSRKPKRARFSKAFVARKLAELSGRAISFNGSEKTKGTVGPYISSLIGHIAKVIGIYDEYRKELIRLIPEFEPMIRRADSDFEKRLIESENAHWRTPEESKK